MGSTFAPSLACLYVDNFERHVVLHEDNPYLQQIKLWKRYIDEILLVWTGTEEEAPSFSNWLNGANHFLNFTMTIGDNKLLFLDLVIYEHDRGLVTEVYYKPTDRNNLLQFQSFHPRALKDNLPVGPFLRLRWNCSTLIDYRKHADKLGIKLQAKDYPTHLVSRARKRARNNNRDQLLQPRAVKPDMEQIVNYISQRPRESCNAFALPDAADDSTPGLPRKCFNDESAVPAPTREPRFRPPRPPDDETAGRGGDYTHLAHLMTRAAAVISHT
ncbi:hypothetical protein NDU88_003891 [Pleurodeles waltl]|uniref:Helix-turn-helix domain-containing protein n=1 Tax=Pleurodeles waltl TaxID=8319 RepID=A0AAV7RFI2_PLEWA|nr:hypothetical protein NDU88_003891 [Pleurodeles waltl]